MPTLATIEHCTGCTACASACPKRCITMVPDENGFCYPAVDPAACIDCGLCETSCPVLSPATKTLPLPAAYAAYTKDEAVRLESSSGGIFTELARSVLAKGGAVFGAAYNEHFQVVHICVENETALAPLRGAKYAQSKLGSTFSAVKQQLDAGRAVLFSGTPCQVAGLKAFLRRDYENLLTLDFVCHSVPSPMAWEKYLTALGDVRSVTLRAKDTGWSRYSYCHRVESDNGVRLIPSSESLYMKLFVGGYIDRACCENCGFKGYSRVSDLTLGDFWGIWNILPEMDDNKGTSVVLCQTERGAQILRDLENRILLKQVSLEDASRENSAMVTPSASHPDRQLALDLIRSGKIEACAEWFATAKPTFRQRLRRAAGKLLGR